jgi:hypothetical protein
MRFCGFLGVGARVRTVTCRGMSVVSRLLVMAGFVVFGRFAMMLRCLRVVFGRFGMMFCSFLRHWTSSSARIILRWLNPRAPLSVPHRTSID